MKRHIPISLAGLFLAYQVSAFAAVTPASIQAAITRAKLLPAGTSLSVNVGKNQANVATYRNSKASENDCKIDAVMIAKTVMELAPDEITNVTVYFYNRSDLSAFDQVTLSAGDIKAFGSGELKTNELLSSVKLEHHEAEDAARISNYIQASQRRIARRPAEAQLTGENVSIKVDMESWVPARDIQHEALRIAQKVLGAYSNKRVQAVMVTFTDPDEKMPDKQIVFPKADEIRSIDARLSGALAALSLSRGVRLSLADTEGPLQDARREVSKRIMSLRLAGADIGAIESEFNAMQQAARDENETKIKTRLKKLDEEMSAAEKSIKPVAVARSQNATAITAPELKAAIESAHVLAPGTRTTVAIKANEAVVATYKAEIANAKDCKIDAVLIAKTVMDAAPSNITSVTVYFYGRNDLSSYEEIRLSAGDVKAFASGQLTREQLLSSLTLEHKKTEDAALISSAIDSSEGAGTARTAQATIKGNSVEIGVQMPSWVLDSDAKYEALRIAEKVFESNKGKAIQSVKVTFVDPEFFIGNREVVVNAAVLPTVEALLTSALTPVAFVRSGDKTEIADGPMKEERQNLQNRIGALKNIGVGVNSFDVLFKDVEAAAIANDQAALVASVTKLTAALDVQDQAIKALKAKKTQEKAVASVALAPAITVYNTPPITYAWILGCTILPKVSIQQPESSFKQFEQDLTRLSSKELLNGRILTALCYYCQKLHLAADEAAKNNDPQAEDILRDAQLFDRKAQEQRQKLQREKAAPTHK